MKIKIMFLLGGIVVGVLGSTAYYGHVSSPASHELPGLPAPYYKTLFENEVARVVEHQLEPGQTEPMHEHPSMFVYFISGAHLEISMPDGSSFEETLTDGLTFDLPKLSHSIRNLGDTTLKSILVEFK